PEMTNLHPNYPNPFNPVTNIRYDIGLLDGLRQNVSIYVYNLLGQRIRTLVKIWTSSVNSPSSGMAGTKLGKICPQEYISYT
ncbi:MAG TPA: hypothetical protein QF698_07045, partial [Candidatus Marinimicrobia bacterium]|nr:hypothetical protein [Candidatus Neomarinimicrobiota bacterium]